MKRKKTQETRDLAQQLLALAESQPGTAQRIVAHHAMGATSVRLGAFANGCKHCEQGIALYDRQQHRALGPIYGQDDPGVSCLVWAAWSLWHLGYPDQALHRSRAAIDLAREVSQPFSLAWALNAGSWTRSYRREGRTAYELAEMAIDVATQQEYPHWIAMGKIMRGQALVQLGQWEAAVSELWEGNDAYMGTGAERPISPIVPLAQAYGQGGRPEEGLHTLGEVLVRIDEFAVRQIAAEVYRTQGDLLLQLDVPDEQRAEACFHQALSIARRQQARSLELRAATSRARLWQSQSKRQDARELLAPVYGWFTEGFDTADLQEAKALLEELS